MDTINSIGFPRMFQGNSANVITNKEATLSNIRLLLLSEAGEFSYDPEYGIQLKKFTFEQNNYILRDILIDEIYTKLTTFFPQILISRRNIEVTQKNKSVFVKITFKNKQTFETNTYNLQIFTAEDN